MNVKKFPILALAVSLSFSTIGFASSHDVSDANERPLEHLATKQTAKSILMAKLASLEHFSANFSQQVITDSGELLEQSAGKLVISKPNLANWHTSEPDELAIVSDGKDVWFYNPWIEQVSVYSLSAAIAKTPILLLTSRDEALWQDYHVSVNRADNNASFTIKSLDINSQIKSLTLVFDSKDKTDQLKTFSFLDATGQTSNITLTNFDSQSKPVASLFKFDVPDGVQIDDQRIN